MESGYLRNNYPKSNPLANNAAKRRHNSELGIATYGMRALCHRFGVKYKIIILKQSTEKTSYKTTLFRHQYGTKLAFHSYHMGGSYEKLQNIYIHDSHFWMDAGIFGM